MPMTRFPVDSATGMATRPFPIASSTSGPSVFPRQADIEPDVGRHPGRPCFVVVREVLVPAHRSRLGRLLSAITGSSVRFMAPETDCYSCAGNAEIDQLPMRDRIAFDECWRVAHAFNSTLPGWLVLLPRRHVTSIADLTDAEATSLGSWQVRLSRALHAVTGCTKTYVAQFAEAEGFAHVHFHIVARPAGPRPRTSRAPGVRLARDERPAARQRRGDGRDRVQAGRAAGRLRSSTRTTAAGGGSLDLACRRPRMNVAFMRGKRTECHSHTSCIIRAPRQADRNVWFGAVMARPDAQHERSRRRPGRRSSCCRTREHRR